MNLSGVSLNNVSDFEPKILYSQGSSRSQNGFWIEMDGILVTNDVKAHCEYKLSQYNFLAEKIKWANDKIINYKMQHPKIESKVKVLLILNSLKTIETENKNYPASPDFVKVVFNPMIKYVEEKNINMEPEDFILSVVKPIANSYINQVSIEKMKPVSLMMLKGFNDKNSVLGSITQDVICCIIKTMFNVNLNFYQNFQSFPDFSGFNQGV